MYLDSSDHTYMGRCISLWLDSFKNGEVSRDDTSIALAHIMNLCADNKKPEFVAFTQLTPLQVVRDGVLRPPR